MSDSANRKTIIINPDLFSVSSKTKKNKRPDKNIRMKAAADANNKTTKAKIIKNIREQQRLNYNKMISEYNKKMAHVNGGDTQAHTPDDAELASAPAASSTDEFKESLDFLKNSINNSAENLSSPHQPQHTNENGELLSSSAGEHILKHYHKMNDDERRKAHNETLKISAFKDGMFKENLNNQYVLSNQSIAEIPLQYIAHQPSPQTPTQLQSIHTHPATNILPPPKYGILKNGNLPTYRNFFNKTQKNHNNVNLHTDHGNGNPNVFSIQNGNTNTASPQAPAPTPHYSVKQRYMDNVIKPKLKTFRQKKTVRRTFKVGKSKYAPRVGVLVSNKTIRHNVETKHQLLKQIPVEEIRKYLVKRGLMKVGSAAPENVLRKLYESAIMIDGEIQNHNKEITLHNYLNE